MTPIDDLFKALTEDQVFDLYLGTLETLGIPARAWRPGGVARSILRVVARTYAGFTTILAQAIKAGFLDTAEGIWLTRLAWYGYGVRRRESTFATGKLTLVNTLGGLFDDVAAGSVRFVAPGTGKVYTNVATFDLGIGGTVTIDIRAIEAGSGSSALPGAITEFETPMLGVTATNAAAVVGTDDQPDDELRQQCRDKLAALSLDGPRGAYAYAIRAATRLDGSPVDVNRFAISASSSTGRVRIFAASPSGPVVADDLVAIRASIERVARPDSVTVEVSSAVVVPVVRPVTIWATKTIGLTPESLAAQAVGKVALFERSYPIGGIAKPPVTQGYLYADRLGAILQSADPSIFDVDGLGSDVALNPGEIAQIDMTVTVRFVEDVAA